MHHLEDELGQPLFERSKSGVKLTEFGEFCYPYILNVIKSYESMKNSCAKKNEKSLLIGATRVFIRAFKQRLPQLILQMINICPQAWLFQK